MNQPDTIPDIELMNGVDLGGEIYIAALKVRESHQDWLGAHDVGPVAIYGAPPRLHGNFGVCRAQFHGDLYEPAPDGVPVIVMGVSEHPDEGLVDLLAFKPSDPARWWLRLGNAVLLGLHNARWAVFEESPVMVHATPLDWLRAECRGVVVLDWGRDILSRLEGFGCLAADEQTAKRLEGAFRRFTNIPQIKIKEGIRNAA